MENENQELFESEELKHNRVAIISYFVKEIKKPTVDKVLDAVSLVQSVFGCPLRYDFNYNLETLEVESDATAYIGSVLAQKDFDNELFEKYFSNFYNSEFVTKHKDAIDRILSFIVRTGTGYNTRLMACLRDYDIQFTEDKNREEYKLLCVNFGQESVDCHLQTAFHMNWELYSYIARCLYSASIHTAYRPNTWWFKVEKDY